MNIGFLSTRLAGTDGVSLEAAKLATLLSRRGHAIYYCAGELDVDGPEGVLEPEMHFEHPEIRAIHALAFDGSDSSSLRQRIAESVDRLRGGIRRFIDRFDIDVLFLQNVLAIPMNLPLGIALTEEIAQHRVRTLAHHHDFYWERERFSRCAVQDLLDASFPPSNPEIRHIVINSLAQHELYARRGVRSVVLPNVLDFENGPNERDHRVRAFRKELGLSTQDLVILQPTRIVPRKGIELAVELVSRLSERIAPRRAVLLISHPAGDEGTQYLAHLMEIADRADVRMILAADRVIPHRGAEDGIPFAFDLRDAYESADFVTYPSLIEGFGNAFLEAIYFRKPLLVNRYPVFVSDIEPCGFDVIAVDGTLDEETVARVAALVSNPCQIAQMTEHNYRVAKSCFSYRVADSVLCSLLDGWP